MENDFFFKKKGDKTGEEIEAVVGLLNQSPSLKVAELTLKLYIHINKIITVIIACDNIEFKVITAGSVNCHEIDNLINFLVVVKN